MGADLVPRQDQLPVFQDVIAEMPNEVKELLKGNCFEQAQFLYLQGLDMNW